MSDDPVPVLRDFVMKWLLDLRHCRVPGVTDPLPQGFPLKAFHIFEDFDWVVPLGSDQVSQHSYRVDFVFPGLPPITEAQSPLIWTLSSASVQLGRVQVNADVLWDPDPFLSIDSTLILESMATSVHLALPVYVISHFSFERCDSIGNQRVQIFELRGEDDVSIHLFGARYV